MDRRGESILLEEAGGIARPPSQGSQAAERVGFGRRAAATSIDAVLFIISVLLIGYFLHTSVDGPLKSVPEPDASALANLILGLCVLALLLFFILPEACLGRSLGGMMLGIIVRRQDGSKASVGRLFLRCLVKNSGPVLMLPGFVAGLAWVQTPGAVANLVITVGCFFCLRADRLTFHDMIARTAVYPRKAGAPRPPGARPPGPGAGAAPPPAGAAG